MNRVRISILVLTISTIIGSSIPVIRSRRAHAAPLAKPSNPSRLVVPAGGKLTLKIVENVLRDAKEGETFEALTTEPILAENQLAVPADTRATLHIDHVQKQGGASVDVTMRATELIFSNRKVVIHTVPIVASVQPMSAFNLMVRSAGGMLAAAVGAADRVVIERSPLGAGALEGLAAGSGSSHAFTALHFQIDEAIDVTGIRW